MGKLAGRSASRMGGSLSPLGSLGLAAHGGEGGGKLHGAASPLLGVLENSLRRALKRQLLPAIRLIRGHPPRLNGVARECEEFLQECEKAEILLEMGAEGFPLKCPERLQTCSCD